MKPTTQQLLNEISELRRELRELSDRVAKIQPVVNVYPAYSPSIPQSPCTPGWPVPQGPWCLTTNTNEVLAEFLGQEALEYPWAEFFRGQRS